MLNLDELSGEATRFTWRGREFSVPSPEDYSLDQAGEIGKLRTKFLAAEGDTEKQFEIMKEQLKLYVPGFTDADVGSISQRQVTALMKLLTPTEAEVKPEAISAAS